MKEETLKLVLSFFSILISVTAILISYRAAIQTKRRTSYTNLDTYYNSLLKEALQYPDFRNPEFTTNYEPLNKNTVLAPDLSKTIKQYEIYAFMCWNFCETIYDSCIHADDVHLKKTWDCIIRTENSLHYKWFNEKKNELKFKVEFRDYIRSLQNETC